MTTSDEEDNDSEPEEKLEDPAETENAWPNQIEKAAPKKPATKPDVIKTLIERDPELSTRDL